MKLTEIGVRRYKILVRRYQTTKYRYAGTKNGYYRFPAGGKVAAPMPATTIAFQLGNNKRMLKGWEGGVQK